jgi:site-specific recombinase XerD
MRLSETVTAYLDHKRSLGMKFTAEGFILRAFCNALGDVAMNQVRAGPVKAFLGGSDPDRVTATWTKKFSVITGFYRFALARDHIRTSPLPSRVPKLTEPDFTPYIYSQQELKRMLDAVPAACSSNKVAVEAGTYRTLLLLLYGAGLRLSEALSLTAADVDLDQAILCVRGTKFYKTRLVPLGMDLTFVLARYVGAHHSDLPDAPFFRLRNGERVSQSAARSAFRRVRALAGLARDGGSWHQPRLHDLRHTAAVHRLVAWYRSGENLQFMLPRLATFLGHVNLVGTQRYLTLTPELLDEASARFERYALGTTFGDQS